MEDADLQQLVGKAVYVRTMGAIKLGRLVAFSPSTLALDDASWLADPDMDGGDGRRQSNVLAKGLGTRPDVEPYPDRLFVNRGVVESVTVWRHDLPGHEPAKKRVKR